MLSHRLIACLLSLAILTGCGGSQNNPPPPMPTPSIGQVYAAKGNFAKILRFAAGGTGDVFPQHEISTQPFEPTFLAMDAPHDRLVATSVLDNAVVFLDGASTPGCCLVRAITGPTTTLSGPQSLALDPAADLVYVPGGSNILVFGPASTVVGDVAPLHTLAVSFTVGGIAVDPANDRLFLADTANNAIRVYDRASTLNGTLIADRVISGAATQLGAPGQILVDGSGHLVVAISPFGPGLLIFSNAGTLNGNVAPSSSLSLTPVGFTQFAVSPTGDLYAGGGPEIRVYTNIFSASGALTPARIITGSNTDLDTPLGHIPAADFGIALDPTR